MRKRLRIWVISVVALLVLVAGVWWYAYSEEVVLTTYYPAPYGKYNKLQSKTLTVSDKVGIGTATPGAKLEIHGIQYTQPNLYIHQNGGVGPGFSAPLLRLRDDTTPANEFWDIYGSNGSIPVTNQFRISKTVGDIENWYFTIADNGNVGIGTTTPGAGNKLEVSGRVQASDFFATGSSAIINTTSAGASSQYLYTQNAAGQIYFGVDSSTGASFGNANGGVVWLSSNAPLQFATNNTAKMTILANGNVGIGTTSPTFQGGGVGLQISGSGYSTLSLAAGGTGRNWEFQSTNISSGDFAIFDRTSLNTRLQIQGTTGNVGIGTTNPTHRLEVSGDAANNTGVWATLSDARLKKDIKPLSSALDTILKLQGVSFIWKDAKKGKEMQRGFIAQDVEKVIPEWVKTDKKGYKWLEKTGVEALLTEAIKEQQKQITSYEETTKALSQENTIFKQELAVIRQENSAVKKELSALKQAVAKLQGVEAFNK